MPPPPWLHPRTAYLHVPFCGHHCGYCDFAVTAGHDHLIEPYVDALLAELATLGDPHPVESVFLGGGTPTYLPAPILARLLDGMNHWLPFSGEHEFSVESTPDSLDAEKARVMADRGVNRVSVGVQSFQPHLLDRLDRRHGVEHIGRAVDAVRPRIPDLSFDLIYAAPGQTLAEWDADLSAALAFDPAHLSCYGLTYETGTPLWKARRRGAVAVVPEDAELDLYRHARTRLATAGFDQYEVSNFARPGKRSKHNQRYWANEAYLGFGVGAARYVDGVRALNRRDTRGYIKAVLSGDDPTLNREQLTPRERAFETLATQLRRLDGVDRPRFHAQTGHDLDALTAGRLAHLVSLGLVADDGAGVRLTGRGLEVADGVVEDLLKAA